MTLLARNEEDILRENILFHLHQGVDFIIATDNLSKDSTSEILHEFERQGVLQYIYEAQDTHNQSDWVTKMARLAFTKYHADWVINSDADEFWRPESGNLKSVLSAIPPDTKAVRAKRKNFMPSGSTDEPFYQRMVVCETKSINCLGDPLPPKTVHRASDRVTVGNGNHFAFFESPADHYHTEEITIFHFPARTWSQFSSKIIYGSEALQRNKTLHEGVGATWKYLYNLHLKGELENYYNSLITDPASLSNGNFSGKYHIDTRLKFDFQNINKH